MKGRVEPWERSERPIDPGVDIGHVHLRAADLETIHGFYVGVLGFDVVAHMPDALFLSAGGYHHDLAFNTWQSAGGPPPPAGTTGLYHVAIRYPTRGRSRTRCGGWSRRGGRSTAPPTTAPTRRSICATPRATGSSWHGDRPQDEWPLDDDGHLTWGRRDLDLDGLLAAAAS